MKIPTKKLQNGFELPVYGMGLWEMGGRWEADASQDAKEIEAIRNAIDYGITHFDTAESYGNGHAEEILGEATKGTNRSKLFIATKVSADNQSYDNVLRSFEKSLKRLGTDYVDLYILHRYPNPDVPISEPLRAIDELVRQGAIKNIGVSNMTPARFSEAQRHTNNKIVCNQVHYNVQYREIEKAGILTQCQREDTMLVAWRPVQKGTIAVAPIIQKLASKYNKTPLQIMINWLVSQDHVVTISKTSNLKHLHENLGALDWIMENEDIEIIRENFPNQKFVSDAVPLDYAASFPA